MTRKKSWIVLVRASYRVSLASADPEQVPTHDTPSKFFNISYVYRNKSMNPYKSKWIEFLRDGGYGFPYQMRFRRAS